MSSLLQAILPPPYHLINVFLQIANKLGYQKKKKLLTSRHGPPENTVHYCCFTQAKHKKPFLCSSIV
jgi:hypothetical protein